MNREDEDVFQPAPALSTSTQEKPSLDDPSPGPSDQWTSAGIIAALEPLAKEERAARLKETLDGRIDSVTILFDNPHDPHNGSAVLRSCDAFGVQQIHIVAEREEFTASRMVAKGSHRWVDVVEHRDPKTAADLLHEAGYTLLVTHPEGKLTVEDLPKLDKVALIMGNERDGVSPELTQEADNTIRIPMRGFVESLNVSVTAAILVQAACNDRAGDLSPSRRENTYARWLRKSVPRADEVLSALDPC